MGDVTHLTDWEFGLDGPPLDEGPSTVFQIGDGHLVLLSPDKPLASQFHRLYGDCVVAVTAARGPAVECAVETAAGSAAVIIRTPDPVDLVEFMEAAFGDRGCRRTGEAVDGWCPMQSDEPRVTFRVKGDRVAFALQSPWRHLAANLAVGSVLRLQREVIFMHASGVAIGPRPRAVVFVGAKGAGKTTTSLGLAARGHAFFGDELVGIRTQTWELLPVRRTIAQREGPCDSALGAALEPVALERRRYGDGHWRRMIAPADAFGATPAAAPLAAIVVLDGVGDRAALTPIPASMAAASRLTPVASTMWGQSPAARVFSLMKLLSAVPCYALRLGPPDDTSRLIEATFSH